MLDDDAGDVAPDSAEAVDADPIAMKHSFYSVYCSGVHALLARDCHLRFYTPGFSIRRSDIGKTSQSGAALGVLPVSLNLDGDASIWIHAVSVGEA